MREASGESGGSATRVSNAHALNLARKGRVLLLCGPENGESHRRLWNPSGSGMKENEGGVGIQKNTFATLNLTWPLFPIAIVSLKLACLVCILPLLTILQYCQPPRSQLSEYIVSITKWYTSQIYKDTNATITNWNNPLSKIKYA